MYYVVTSVVQIFTSDLLLIIFYIISVAGDRFHISRYSIILYDNIIYVNKIIPILASKHNALLINNIL